MEIKKDIDRLAALSVAEIKKAQRVKNGRILSVAELTFLAAALRGLPSDKADAIMSRANLANADKVKKTTSTAKAAKASRVSFVKWFFNR